MRTTTITLQLPSYDDVFESISAIELLMSVSELHGVMCGYLAVGADQEGEVYLQALILDKQDAKMRDGLRALFQLYSVSQEQLKQNGFDLQLLLPDEPASLAVRAQAFSEWCEGFTQGLVMSKVDLSQLPDEETQEAIQHIMEFAQLDYESLHISEDDERALMEVIEYARMAVLHIHNDLLINLLKQNGSDTAH